MQSTPGAPRSSRSMLNLTLLLIAGGMLVGGALWFAEWWQQRETRLVADRHHSIFQKASDALDRGEALREEERKRMRAVGETAPFDLSSLTVDISMLRDGGPPKDGIPSLVMPNTRPWNEVDFLEPDDRVLGVTVNGESRAYPINVLNLHEVINDELGGEPIAVIFCPLCDSASVVRRAVGDEVLEFGVSGKLLNSNVLLYDRTHNALWSQVGMRAISGPHAGRSLEHVNAWTLTTLADWVQTHPDGHVVVPPRDSDLNYAMNPYSAYLASDRLMDRFAPDAIDERLPAKTPVIGIRIGSSAVACPVDSIRESGGSVDVSLSDQVVTLRASADNGVQVVSAPAEAHVIHMFWFAWAAFHPETAIVGR